MRPTIPYIKSKFDEYNRKFFGGKLRRIPVELSNAFSYMGVCVYKSRRLPDGSVENYDFRLRISTRMDLPEKEVEDTIIHEMIHYYIWSNQIRDTSTHGKVFRQIMDNINERYGRHITIAHRSTKEEREAAIDKRPRWHVVAIVTFTDGKQGLKLLPRIGQRIVDYHKAVMGSSKVSGIEYYMELDPWFNRYPTSSAFNVIFAPMEVVRAHITGKTTLTVTPESVTINQIHE